MTRDPGALGSRRPALLAALRCALVAVLALLVVPLLLSRPAVASDEGGAGGDDTVARYHLDVGVDEVGTAAVTLDLDVDFGTEPNRGPFLTYLVKEPFAGDRPLDRVYRFSDVRATSSTGAATEVHLEERGGWLEIRIGDEDRDDLTGVHSYQLSYTVEGLVSSANVFEGLDEDELYMDVLGEQWEVPVEDVVVTITAPAEALVSQCVTGSTSSLCASSEREGTTASFTHPRVEPGAGLTVRTTYPAGTFRDVEPILQDRWTFSRAFSLTPWTGGVAVVVTLGGAGLAVRRVRKAGQEEFAGLTQGLHPTGGQVVGIRRTRSGPVAVRFTPPEGLRPGQVGTLVDERADPHDVTATLVDLAVRGHLRIEQVRTDADDADAPSADDAPEDWRLVRLAGSTEDLLTFEQLLLDELFDDESEVLLSDLSETFAASMAKVQDSLYADVTHQGWFTANPKEVRALWGGVATAVILLGVLLTVGLAIWTTWALVGVAVLLVGIVVASMVGSAPARTAAGTAALHEAEGFRLYLETAEADQLRLDEERDLFSRYLPYAIAFGLAERWATVFADLATAGRRLPEPTWFVGPAYAHGAFWASAGTFSRDLTGFTTTADSAISSSTPGTSGAGGPTYTGGGVSGSGGGTW